MTPAEIWRGVYRSLAADGTVRLPPAYPLGPVRPGHPGWLVPDVPRRARAGGGTPEAPGPG
ncbi:hypothetical protein GCM10010420_49330 [Streptomyces glaucosporus]|uniref:Uncharacterized protein n=1 Tax=Streptomyces glaucosporus TaxID=284044 RepID=A0ABP5VXH8_9ACTN